MYTVFCTIAASYGFGQRSAHLTPHRIVNSNRMEIIGQTFCITGIATSKAGVAALLLRLVVQPIQRMALITITTAVGLLCVVTAVFDFVRCSPVQAVWNPFLKDVSCWVSTNSYTKLSISLSGKWKQNILS